MEETLNITCNFLYCNHHVNKDFLITLYNKIRRFDNVNKYVMTSTITKGCLRQKLFNKPGDIISYQIKHTYLFDHMTKAVFSSRCILV